MKQQFSLGILAAVGMTLASPQPQAYGQANEAPWHRDLQTATRLAQQHSKPLMVVFRCER